MGSYYQTMEENRAEIIAIKAWYDLVNEWIEEKNLTWLFLWTWLLASCAMWRDYHQKWERKAYRYHFPLFVTIREAWKAWYDDRYVNAVYTDMMNLVQNGTSDQAQHYRTAHEQKISHKLLQFVPKSLSV
jgi:hypothetical protein